MAWAALIVPAVSAAAVLVFGSTRLRAGATGGAAALAVLIAAIMTTTASDTAAVWSWGPKLELTLDATNFGRIMAILVPAIGVPVIVYAAATEEGTPAELRRLLAGMVAFLGAMELLVLAADLLTLLIGWELVAAFSWMLISQHWRDPARPAAAREAFVITGFGALGLYAAAGALYAATGGFELSALAGVSGGALDVIAIGVLLAAAAKSAQLPFSTWLFAAMHGPTSVSALLHSATMVAAGAYALIRLAPYLTPTGWFAPAAISIGLATVVAGGVVAAAQSDAKRALAGSTSSQYGLVFVAAAAGSTAAAGAQLMTHAAFKSLLFLGAGVAMHAAGTGALRDMRLGGAMSGVALLFGIGVAALAAVPPLGGAYSKELVVAAATERSLWLGLAAALSGVLTAFYAMRLQFLTYGPAGRSSPRRRPATAAVASMGALAGISVWLSVLWLPGAERLLESTTGEAVPATASWEVVVSLAAILLAAAAVWVLLRSRALATLGLPDHIRQGLANWIGLPRLITALVARPVPRFAGALARFDDRAVDQGLANWIGPPRLITTLVVRPVPRFAEALARFDDCAVDAGIRAAARIGRAVSQLVSAWAERGVDGLVSVLARGTMRTVDLSGAFDDRGVGGVIEGLGKGVGAGGSASRRLQTGLAHQYYVILALGALIMLAVALFWT